MGNPKQGYNGQIAVDGEANLIVAGTITRPAADGGQLVPALKEAVANTGQKPKSSLADAGYRSEEDLLTLEKVKVDAHMALGRGESQGGLSSKAGPATNRMHRKRKTKRSQKAYKRRKVIAERHSGGSNR